MGLRDCPTDTTAAAHGKTHCCGKPWFGCLSFPNCKTETVLLIGILVLWELWMKRVALSMQTDI